MNITELKAEANALGYSVTKKITYEKLLRCPCGNSRWVTSEVTFGGKYYRCSKCGYKGEIAKFKYEAIQNWNNAARNYDAWSKYINNKFTEVIK